VAEKLPAGAFRSLLQAGLVRGEFGGYRAPDDGVLRDFVVFLYEREIAGKPLDEVLRQALAGRRPSPAPEETWSLTVPLLSRSELVIAESLAQVGKNLHVPEETIGQLQLAVIEACINAIEHTKGGDGRLTVAIRSLPDRLEVSVESPGREFVQAETGEPVAGTAAREGATRGQGIKLMKRFADEVRFERAARGTRVVLVKRLSRTNAPAKEGVSHRE
jgi:anti-sigma regulatory factor (Ser/Thr protein kinase)